MSAQRRTRSERRRDQRRERRHPKQRSIWRGPAPIVVALALVALVIAGFYVYSQQQRQATPSGADADAIVAAVTSVPRTTLDAIGPGALANPLHATGAADVLKGPAGRPVVVYVGAEYCPFCASERWSLVVALSRFGTFRGLGLTTSSSTDVYPNTPTFTFTGSTYTSDAIELAAVETQDREQRPIATPTALESQSLQRYDAQGSIPYLSIADRAYQVGSGYPPDVLAGKTWQQIADALKDQNSSIGRAILGNANYITAAICDATAQTPASVCDDPALRALAKPK